MVEYLQFLIYRVVYLHCFPYNFYALLCLRLKYPYDSGLLLSTCTVVPMFYNCGELRNKSRRVMELRKIRQLKKKEQKIKDIPDNDADQYLWRKVYNIYNHYEMGNNEIDLGNCYYYKNILFITVIGR